MATGIYKKLHKWPGFIISFILLYYSVSGIFMNHRSFFSSLDLSRNILPAEFRHSNWNNSALRGNIVINKDSILVYGNIGVYVTDSAFSTYRTLNAGFPKGSDNHKVTDLFRAKNGDLYAATLFGLFGFDTANTLWKKFDLKTKNPRFTGITQKGDTLYVLNRSHLFKAVSRGIQSNFTKISLKAPVNYKKEAGLFQTLWQSHSGEIFGMAGKLFVDLLGIITIFLSVTGIIYFLFPGWLKRRKHRKKKVTNIAKVNRWSLKWHNKLGAWLFICLIILYGTGMFLRPPLLISIAGKNVKPIKFTHLDQPNPWHDRLRDILYDAERNLFLISTSKGMYYLQNEQDTPKPFNIQPPVSVMGINVFEPYHDGAYIIGSFSGIFLWHPMNHEILNYATGKVYKGNTSGKPVGDFKTTGLLTGMKGEHYLVEYDQGCLPLWHNQEFPEMPYAMVKNAKISLWNCSLEIHTGRIFRSILGDFYILLVPLGGLVSLMVVISGYLLWRKKFRKKK